MDENGASALGSVHYFSPEQARGEVADEKSDLYSVGVVMYEMLTGHVPFDGETSVSVALKHVSEAPKSMRLFQGGISKALDEVVMHALSKDASQRYQTAAEMAADLRKTVTHPRGGFVKYPLNPEEQERQREAPAAQAPEAPPPLDDHRHWWSWFLHPSSHCWEQAGITCSSATAFRCPTSSASSSRPRWKRSNRRNFRPPSSAPTVRITRRAWCWRSPRKPGERIRRGSSVTLVVSAGTQWYELENLTGQYEADALDWLAVQGAADVTVEYVQDEAPVGEVVAQSLEPGTQSKDAPLTLTVSGRTVLMPPLTGLTLEGATALLQSEGLVLGEVTEGESPDAPAHTVIAQNIAPNSQVLAGTAIDLTLCAGRETIYRPDCEFTVMVPLDNLEVVDHRDRPLGHGDHRLFPEAARRGPRRFPLQRGAWRAYGSGLSGRRADGHDADCIVHNHSEAIACREPFCAESAASITPWTTHGTIHTLRAQGKIRRERAEAEGGRSGGADPRRGRGTRLDPSAILPRRNELARPPVANIDRIVVVVAAATPDPDLTLADRMLINARRAEIEAMLVVNKSDLNPETAADIVNQYRGADVSPMAISASTGEGLDALRQALARQDPRPVRPVRRGQVHARSMRCTA